MSEGNDNPWWGRLGVEPPADGGSGQNVAEPAETEVPAEATPLNPPLEGGQRGTGAAGEAEVPAGDCHVGAGAPPRNDMDGGAYKAGVPAGTEVPAGRTGASASTDENLGAAGEAGVPAEATPLEPPLEGGQRGTGVPAGTEVPAGDGHVGAGAPPRNDRLESAEREALETRLREEHAENMKAVFASMGLRTADGKAVVTQEDFEAYQAEQRSSRVRRDLKNGNLTPEALRQAVLDAPEVKQVLENAQTATRNAQRAQEEAKQVSFQANMQRELAEIRKLNPAIRSTDDIIRMETGPEYARLLRSGLSPSEAYKLANFDAIRTRERNAAEQAARNANAGKSHLQGVPNAGKAPLVPPKEYAQQLRRFMPELTDKEIAKYYAKHNKGGN